MQSVNNVPSIGLSTSTSQSPGGSARCQTKFTQALTFYIIAQCKASSFSVIVGTPAAIVGITSKNANVGNSADKSKSSTNFDLHKYCPPEYNSAKKAVSNFHTEIPVVIKPSKIQEDAVQFQTLYSRRLNAPVQENMFPFLTCHVESAHAVHTTTAARVIAAV